MHPKEYFKEGSIYNKEYFGPNEAYKAQNGSTTFQITEIDGDKIKIQELFTRHPKHYTPDLRGNPISWTLSALVACQHEYKITEVTEQRDFFIHSQLMPSMADALKYGLVTLDRIKHLFRDKSKDYMCVCPLVWYGGPVSLEISAEQGVSSNKYLQTICFYWESGEAMRADIRSVYPEAWFM